LASCSGRRYQNVPQAAPRHYGRAHQRRRPTWAIATVCFVLLLTTKIDTLWMILGAALVSFTASSIGLVAYL
jgi:chromate transport protein ChrA